jgi:hypothetical protein
MAYELAVPTSAQFLIAASRVSNADQKNSVGFLAATREK